MAICKSAYLQVLLFIGFLGCGGGEAQQDIDMPDSTPCQPVNTKLAVTPITFRQAVDLYAQRSEKTKRTLFPWPKHDCSDEKDSTFEYLRLVKGVIDCEHIGFTVDNLPSNFGNGPYTGIRIYPFQKRRDKNKPQDYLLVYTVPVDALKPNDKQKDVPSTFMILEDRVIDWCGLKNKLLLQHDPLHAHFLCRPTCDPDGEPSLNY